jgi:hypothetical protein
MITERQFYGILCVICFLLGILFHWVHTQHMKILSKERVAKALDQESSLKQHLEVK